MLTPSLASTQK